METEEGVPTFSLYITHTHDDIPEHWSVDLETGRVRYSVRRFVESTTSRSSYTEWQEPTLPLLRSLDLGELTLVRRVVGALQGVPSPTAAAMAARATRLPGAQPPEIYTISMSPGNDVRYTWASDYPPPPYADGTLEFELRRLVAIFTTDNLALPPPGEPMDKTTWKFNCATQYRVIYSVTNMVTHYERRWKICLDTGEVIAQEKKFAGKWNIHFDRYTYVDYDRYTLPEALRRDLASFLPVIEEHPEEVTIWGDIFSPYAATDYDYRYPTLPAHALHLEIANGRTKVNWRSDDPKNERDLMTTSKHTIRTRLTELLQAVVAKGNIHFPSGVE